MYVDTMEYLLYKQSMDDRVHQAMSTVFEKAKHKLVYSRVSENEYVAVVNFSGIPKSEFVEQVNDEFQKLVHEDIKHKVEAKVTYGTENKANLVARIKKV